MSHTPVLQSGAVFKRKLNAIRPVPGGGPIPPVPDPFYSDVLLLLSLDELGTTFTDFGPLANIVTPIDPDSTITQDTSVTLFGQPMGHVGKLGLDDQGLLYVVNNASPLGAGDDLCIEYWCYQESYSAATSAPVHQRWAGYSGVPDGSQYWTILDGGTGDLVYRATGSPDESELFTLNTMHYVAQQFVAADGAMYCSMDGVLLATIPTVMVPRGGWEARVFSNSTGPALQSYELHIGQYRVTRANRYGNAAAPIPAGPWAKS